MKTGNRSRRTTLLGLLTAILMVFGMTPLGYLNVGPLAISFNMIPVAIGAAALGPVGGAILGAVFGMTSFLQCLGIGGSSAMGVILFDINPIFAFIQRFVPRVTAGFLVGVIYQAARRFCKPGLAGSIAGFCAALLNTVLFMGALVLLFGNTQYLTDLIAGRNVIVFICTFVGVNAVAEMLATTAVTGALTAALERSGLLRR
ncbi:MAG: ECF transporter S component [Oscillospiraceae bacterium]|nr:ECF transporter S component [Oscillospiraceae bacterium]